MFKKKSKFIALGIFLILFFMIGCNDKVNFAKAEKVVNSYISAQVEGNKNKINNLLSPGLEEKFKKEKLYFCEKYDLKKPKLAKVNIYEMQSSGQKKIFAANYLIEGKGGKLNNVCLIYLEKDGEKWIIKDINENSLNKSL